VLSRSRLERLVIEFNLYEAERKTGIMEDVIATMLNHIEIVPTSGRTFAIRYTGDDPLTVMKVTEKLASYFSDDFAIEDERLSSNTMKFLEAQVEETGRRLSEQQARAKAAGTTEDRRVKIEASVLESIYTRLLTNLEEARGRLKVTRTMTGPQLVVVDPARKPERPITPSVLEQTWVGALGGLATGVAMALVVFGIRMWRGRPPASPMPELAGR
jgi:hypothetical protein